MKGIAFILFALIGAFMAVTGEINHNGEPGCKTASEVSIRLYRNNWDPTHYWICNALNVAAESARCPDFTAFNTASRTCVPWEEWVWIEPIEPPSRP